MGTPMPARRTTPFDPEWVVKTMMFATETLLKSRSHATFFGKHPNGKSVVIMPLVGRDKVAVQVLYDLRNNGVRASFVGVTWDDIREDWRKHCRAFVDFRLDPLKSAYPFAIDFDGTVRAKRELEKTPMIYPPSRLEIDTALGTKLSAVSLRNTLLEEHFA